MLHRRDRVLAWALPVVLIIVALTQITLAHTRDLTPWKGGGFGMFSSVDLLTYRPLKVEFATEEGMIPVDVHDFSEASDRAGKLYTNARGLPDDRRLDQLADLMLDAEWIVTDGVAVFAAWLDNGDEGPVLRDADEPDGVAIDGLELEIWRVTYERGDDFIVPELIRTYRLALDSKDAGA